MQLCHPVFLVPIFPAQAPAFLSCAGCQGTCYQNSVLLVLTDCDQITHRPASHGKGALYLAAVLAGTVRGKRSNAAVHLSSSTTQTPFMESSSDFSSTGPAQVLYKHSYNFGHRVMKQEVAFSQGAVSQALHFLYHPLISLSHSLFLPALLLVAQFSSI